MIEYRMLHAVNRQQLSVRRDGALVGCAGQPRNAPTAVNPDEFHIAPGPVAPRTPNKPSGHLRAAATLLPRNRGLEPTMR
jgi:hypothetical protein